ncbi:hypothetical protein B0H16DRAFT_1536084, partial [Mycena metata]
MTATPVPGIPNLPSDGPPTIVVIAQALLFISLFSTLLAALLAVLGKQWLLQYDSVGEKGTIGERALERQRKFDGIRRWKFALVLQICPVLLQFSLFLFAAALSTYLWTVHHVIAAIVLILTSLSFVSYVEMVRSAAVSPDSPFQTSLSTLLTKIMRDRTALPLRAVREFSRKLMDAVLPRLRSFFSQCGVDRLSLPLRSGSSRSLDIFRPLPPLGFEGDTSHEHTPIFHSPPPQSKEVSAVLWVLETSTDPAMVQSAAEMVPELQWWPITSDVRPALKRLADIFNSCFTGEDLHTGMEARAMACIRAFGVLETVTEVHQRTTDLWTFERQSLPRVHRDLYSIMAFFRLEQFREIEGPPMTRWTLQVIPARQPPTKYLPIVLKHFGRKDSYTRDDPAFADFLFCVISFFRPTSARDRAVQDKSPYMLALTTLLFQTLTQNLTSHSFVDSDIVTDIIARVLLFAGHMPRAVYAPSGDPSCRKAIYDFCVVPRVSEQQRLWAIRLIRLDYLTLDGCPMIPDTHNVAWVYRSLEKLGSSRTRHPEFVGDLLQALYLSQPVQTKPSPDALDALLWALILPPDESGLTFGEWENLVGDHGSGRLKYFAASVLCFADNWFHDIRLGPPLAHEAVWINLGQSMHPHFITLGNKLSRIPQWRNIISQNLESWLAQYPLLSTGDANASDEFCAVLSHIWDIDESEAHRFGKEKLLAMMFMALATAWDTYDFSPSSHRRVLRLLESTVSTAFFSRILHWAVQTPSQAFRDDIMTRLGVALAQAGKRCHSNQRPIIQSAKRLQDVIDATATVLTTLALTVNGELRSAGNGPVGAKYLTEHRDGFMEEVSRLYRALGEDVTADGGSPKTPKFNPPR